MTTPDEIYYQGWGPPARPSFLYARLGPIDFGIHLTPSLRYMYLSNRLISDERDLK